MISTGDAHIYTLTPFSSPTAAALVHCVVKDLHTNNGIGIENDAQEQANTAEEEGVRMEYSGL